MNHDIILLFHPQRNLIDNARYQNMSQLSIKLIMLKICYFLNPKKLPLDVQEK